MVIVKIGIRMLITHSLPLSSLCRNCVHLIAGGGVEPFIWFLNLSSWSQGIVVLGKLYLLRQGTEVVFNQI